MRLRQISGTITVKFATLMKIPFCNVRYSYAIKLVSHDRLRRVKNTKKKVVLTFRLGFLQYTDEEDGLTVRLAATVNKKN